MLSRHFTKLTKPMCLAYVKNIKNFNTGNKLMERIPRNLRYCDHLRPAHVPMNSEDTEPRASTDTSFCFGKHEAPPVKNFNIFDPSDWCNFMRKQLCEKEQQCDIEQLEKLGNEIYAAQFIIKWGGQVKFKNSDWMPHVKDVPVRLPITKSSKYVITAINADDTRLTYKGLENLLCLGSLKWLSLKNCSYIDDWCIDRISGNMFNLEYLDISGCKNVTEKALEALYKLENLKTLIITNHYKSATFELYCMMLEDCLPDLKCQIFNSRYPYENEKPSQKE